MSAPRSRSALVLLLTAVVAGCAIVVFAVLALLRDPSDDAAWVAVVLGGLFVAWGITFDRLPDDDDDDDDGDGDHHSHDQGWTPRRLNAALSTGLTMTGAYVVIRALGRPVDTALVGALAWPAWRLVNRILDGVIRRRGARGEADGATD
ncbi:hypothetical protein [Curtobacterium sp. MCBA15_013]|uniref:hypothetical protein n=1 Tax=Curtobacterium sp. MCBA15_013 TaxID=1898739 RepID=UPI00091E5ED4|nr:hypothetical protein [Curtobacterium sp. MCBA15_013]OII23183.1 hypothetical protein BIV01_16690 [Curtobacterium sp. MCBA15_013]